MRSSKMLDKHFNNTTLVQIRSGHYDTHPTIDCTDHLIPNTSQVHTITNASGITLDTHFSYICQGTVHDQEGLALFATQRLATCDRGWSLSARDSTGTEHSYGDWWPFVQRTHDLRLAQRCHFTTHAFAGTDGGIMTILWKFAHVEIVWSNQCGNDYTALSRSQLDDGALEHQIRQRLSWMAPKFVRERWEIAS